MKSSPFSDVTNNNNNDISNLKICILFIFKGRKLCKEIAPYIQKKIK